MRPSHVAVTLLGILTSVFGQLEDPSFDTITSPSQGQVVQAGSPFDITWSPGGVTGTISITLLGGSSKITLQTVSVIASGIDNLVGKYTWIPADDDFNVHGLMISHEQDTSLTQYSNEFSISGGSSQIQSSTATLRIELSTASLSPALSSPTEIGLPLSTQEQSLPSETSISSADLISEEQPTTTPTTISALTTESSSFSTAARSSTSAESRGSSSTSPLNTSTPLPSKHKSFSVGAAVGIGVAATLVALSLLAGLVYFIYRYRKRGKELRRLAEFESGAAGTLKPELEAGVSKPQVPELSGNDARNELGGSSAPPVYELKS